MVHAIPTLMDVFERDQLQKFTPCVYENIDDVVQALADVHVELMLIHPFREGNGRIGRLLATLMALQAGLPVLDFGDLDGSCREEYFSAVRAWKPGLSATWKDFCWSSARALPSSDVNTTLKSATKTFISICCSIIWV